VLLLLFGFESLEGDLKPNISVGGLRPPSLLYPPPTPSPLEEMRGEERREEKTTTTNNQSNVICLSGGGVTAASHVKIYVLALDISLSTMKVFAISGVLRWLGLAHRHCKLCIFWY